MFCCMVTIGLAILWLLWAKFIVLSCVCRFTLHRGDCSITMARQDMQCVWIICLKRDWAGGSAAVARRCATPAPGGASPLHRCAPNLCSLLTHTRSLSLSMKYNLKVTTYKFGLSFASQRRIEGRPRTGASRSPDSCPWIPVYNYYHCTTTIALCANDLPTHCLWTYCSAINVR